jgi:hypothetical protein
MKRHRSFTPAQKAAAAARRAELIARSLPLQAARKSGILPWAELPTVNACLEVIYARQTGQTEWRTFLGWKKAGFFVLKGEHGFPVWGRPLEIKPGESDAATRAEGANADERGFEFFPVSYLFHAGQVTDKDGFRPVSHRAENAFAALLRSLPLALPAPADVAALQPKEAA